MSDKKGYSFGSPEFVAAQEEISRYAHEWTNLPEVQGIGIDVDEEGVFITIVLKSKSNYEFPNKLGNFRVVKEIRPAAQLY